MIPKENILAFSKFKYLTLNYFFTKNINSGDMYLLKVEWEIITSYYSIVSLICMIDHFFFTKIIIQGLISIILCNFIYSNILNKKLFI